MKIAAIISVFAVTLAAQVPAQPAGDPAYAPLTQAFDALRSHDYDDAVVLFRETSALSPDRTDIRKNLAYTLLKTGDNDGARDQFGEAMRADPSDFHVALEYAFLCFEAIDDAPARKAEARRIFANVREHGDAESRATAAAAFRNIDEPLSAGIARWRQALATSQPTFSAYYSLAQLAEQRDELPLAAASYLSAFQLLPERRSVLLELARVRKAQGDSDGMMAALIAASRGPEPRAAELARERLPERYPYVYEFRAAVALDPSNEALHKELAYLLLRMSDDGHASRDDAEKEFAVIVSNIGASNGAAQEDYIGEAQLGLLYLGDHLQDRAMPLLNRVLAHGDDATANRVRMALNMPTVLVERQTAASPSEQRALDPRVLGERSYQAGFLKDALKYFTQAEADNPLDLAIALKLGWTNNLLHDDSNALRWFGLARQSSDPAVAAEARRAWTNLHPDEKPFRTTFWLYPLFSSRWGDLFGYGQVKTEFRVKGVPVHPYASVRLAGDVRRTTSGPLPQSLSESALITALGAATDTWHGATAWFEAGVATGYLTGNHWSDYRGGVAYAKTHGAALTAERPGWFLETDADSVYISHFNEDLINYLQSRFGYTAAFEGAKIQGFWNQNFTFDVKSQYWANFMEIRPGFSHPLRLHGLPAPMWINLSAVRGVYLRNEGNPGRPNFNDFRIGVWYAVTK